MGGRDGSEYPCIARIFKADQRNGCIARIFKADYFDTIAPESRARFYKKQLEKLGFNVTLETREMAA